MFLEKMTIGGLSKKFSELKNFGRKTGHFVKILRAGRSFGKSLGFSNFLKIWVMGGVEFGRGEIAKNRLFSQV